MPAEQTATGPDVDQDPWSPARGRPWPIARLRRVACLAVVVLGVCALAGWVLGVNGLILLGVDHTPMRPVVAVGLLLTALSLAARTTLHRRGIAGLAAAGVLAIGVFSLVTYAVAAPVPLERWLFGPAGGYPSASASRVPPATGLSLVLLGLGLVLVHRGARAAKQAHVLSVVVLYLCYVALVGHVFGGAVLYRMDGITTMPAQSAAGLGFASLALLAVVPDHGLIAYLSSRGAAGILVRRVVVLVPLVLPVMMWVVLRWHRSGFLDEGTSHAVTAACAMVLVTTVAWRSAVVIGALERSREHAHQLVVRANRELEDRVVRRTAEVVRRTAEFTSAFESAPVGMAILDPDGRVCRTNDALCRLLGRAPADVVATHIEDLAHPEDRAELCAQAALLANGTLSRTTMECRLRRSDGDDAWTHLTATLLPAGGDTQAQYLLHVVDISERKRHEAQLERLANHDPLTDLLNRRGFAEQLRAHLAEHMRYGDGGALLLLDLDNFKLVNDTLGHATGDRLVVAVAEALRHRLRATDIVARLGGDEFAVLLPRARYADAIAVAETVRTSLAEQATRLGLTTDLPVTASIGIALFDDPALTPDEVIANADLAMYQAKTEGRDRWAYQASRAPDALGPDRSGWAQEIEHALRTDAFVLYAQPLVRLPDRAVVGHEMLLRLPTGAGDLVLPGTLLPVARKLAMVDRIDHWVVEHAIASAGSGSGLVFVNVSLGPGRAADLADAVSSALDRYPFAPERLVLEIGENDAVLHAQQVDELAAFLRRRGARLAVDEFAGSMGSLYFLKHLPVDFVKLSGDLVGRCGTDVVDRATVSAIVQVCRSKGVQTVAQSVPDELTAAFLQEVGVDLGQGFHLGHPAPATVG